MITLASQQLPHAVWVNEYNYVGVAEHSERALNGAAHIEKTLIPNGQPITIISEMESAAVFSALLHHARNTLSAFTINIKNQPLEVVWAHEQGAIEGTPVANYSDNAPEHFTDIKLHLKTV